MRSGPWNVLIVDDNAAMAAAAKRELEDVFAANAEHDVAVSVDLDFDSGFRKVAAGECDVVVLDVRREKTRDRPEDSTRGQSVYSEVQKIRFLPVIFHTALGESVEHLSMPPLVQIIAKDELERLPAAVTAAIDSGVAEVTRAIEEHVASVMREHLWDELAPNWDEDTGGGNPAELAHVLITRVARSLEDRALPELAVSADVKAVEAAESDEDETTFAPERASHRYIYPPVSDSPQPGDILRLSTEDGIDEWHVILTPACDLEQKKVEFVLLGRAKLLELHPKHVAWAENNRSKSKWEPLWRVLSGTQARFLYLPAYRDIPDLVVDLEQLTSVPTADLQVYIRVASMDRPFGEALLTQHSHFRGRIGTPDLDQEVLRARLEAVAIERSRTLSE